MSRLTAILTALVLLACPVGLCAQGVQIRGYLKELPAVAPNDTWQDITLDNLLHQRTNLTAFLTPEWTAALELRTRLFVGETVRDTPNFADLMKYGDDWVDLSVSAHERAFLLQMIVDRLWLDYERDRWQIRLGRQRINWGMNLVWNPHDIFNTYSFFDFDYEERPGADGIRAQFYVGPTSKIEAALKLARNPDDIVAAGLWRFNRYGYDFQLIGGRYAGRQVVLGGGWAGQIGGGGFRGEACYYAPIRNDDGEPYWVAAISADYTLANSLYFHAEGLYNQHGATGKARVNTISQAPPANQLSAARHSVFSEVGYQLSPLLRGTLAGIFNPHDRSGFLGPSLAWSMKTNWDLLLLAQVYQGRKGTEFGDLGRLLFIRLKWSF